MSKILVSVEVDPQDIVIELVQELEHEELLALVKRIDETACDWDFTRMLYKHFKKLNKIYKEEVAND